MKKSNKNIVNMLPLPFSILSSHRIPKITGSNRRMVKCERFFCDNFMLCKEIKRLSQINSLESFSLSEAHENP
ncbi:CLUMA_CG007340, isoform A [Clunio marinus]|uniref:CLUMA_CG007340, isoform A n=1 Tax=Clunio marinus TaxID=568069 RepID=A0A1J1I0L7_9DIPT|nr:CLUMA_CG007340, isoform A [Clunio marinus]